MIGMNLALHLFFDVAGVMFESMVSSFSSMTDSMYQLAEQCMEEEARVQGDDSESASKPLKGVEEFAHLIETGACQDTLPHIRYMYFCVNVLSFDLSFSVVVILKVKGTLVDTVIRFEHVPKGGSAGIALEVRIDRCGAS